jgi:hypothetical protein
MRPKLLTATLLSLLLADAAVHAQAPPPPIDTIQVEVNLLLLSVIVRDTLGNPVDNLRKEDFKVLDQGKSRPIAGFTVEKAPNTVSTVASIASQPVPTAASQQPAPPAPSAAPNRFIVFIHNTNDLEGGFKTLLAAPECLYLLELPLQDVKQNGVYHSLKVEVTQPGLAQSNFKVQSRKGYFAPLAAKK